MSAQSKGNRGRKKKGGPKVNNGIPTGDILVDSSKKEWVIHSSIASGGFGEIYTASNAGSPSLQNYIIKIEPSENGPLFCEKTVYIRIGKEEDIKDYMKLKGLKSLGMPQFYGSGIHMSDGKKFRFLVMDRYGKDLWSIFLEQDRIFPASAVFKVAIQVLDVLEYIHSKGYVHADIKGPNLLLGRKKGFENQVYLVDFGLAARYTSQYKADPRRAHNGTIEYTSRDGHEGIVTRRGDIEVLGFNILQWISSNLPWELTKDLTEVHNKKKKYMKDCNLLLQTCFEQKTPPRALEKYFNHLANMGPLEEPKYNQLKQYMTEGIAASGDSGHKLDFTPVRSTAKSKSKSTSKTSPSPVPVKVRKVATPAAAAANNNNNRRVGRSGQRTRTAGTSRPVNNVTVNLSDEDEVDDDEDEDEDEVDDSDDDDFIESTPEKKTRTPIKRSWKDCPSVVACAELLMNNDRTGRRSKRNK